MRARALAKNRSPLTQNAWLMNTVPRIIDFHLKGHLLQCSLATFSGWNCISIARPPQVFGNQSARQCIGLDGQHQASRGKHRRARNMQTKIPTHTHTQNTHTHTQTRDSKKQRTDRQRNKCKQSAGNQANKEANIHKNRQPAKQADKALKPTTEQVTINKQASRQSDTHK